MKLFKIKCDFQKVKQTRLGIHRATSLTVKQFTGPSPQNGLVLIKRVPLSFGMSWVRFSEIEKFYKFPPCLAKFGTLVEFYQ